ncbi:MAG: PAS domain S-box protein [Thermodesulfovibrionales bacterium]
METVLIIATLLGGISALWYFWDKIVGLLKPSIEKENLDIEPTGVEDPYNVNKDFLLFISHAAEDSTDAKELARKLREAGVNVWIDVDNLTPGVLWQVEIEDALKNASAFLVYIGKSGVTGWVDREIRYALSRNTKDGSFRIIPVLGPNAPDFELLPPFLIQHQAIDLRLGIKGGKEIRKLLEVILGKPPEVVSVLKKDESPFIGLFSFKEETAHLFFGRDKEIDELSRKVYTKKFLAVTGDSGSGKSSLIRAGLIPALRRGIHESSIEQKGWYIIVIRPGNDPLSQLALGLLELDTSLKGAEKLGFIKESIKTLQGETDGLIKVIASLGPFEKKILIVVDQLEELFTLLPGNDNRNKRLHFIDLLINASNFEGEKLNIHIILILRADFYGHCWEHGSLPLYISKNQFAVTKMSKEAFKLAIEEPTALSLCKFEPGLVETILEDIGEEPGNLPLLQHAMHLLWQKRHINTLTHDAYKEIGKIHGAIATHAEKVFDEVLDEPQKEIAKKIFIRLTQLGEETKDTRRRVSLKDLIPKEDANNTTTKAIDILSSEESRLLTVSSELSVSDYATNKSLSEEETFVEVSHEALISNWPRLKDWLHENRSLNLLRQKITQACNEWIKSNNDESLLWPHGKLSDARRLLDKHYDLLNSNEIEYITKSIEIFEKELSVKTRAKHYDLLLSTMQDGVISFDKNYIIIFANKFLEDWANITASEVIGKSALEIFHEKGGACPHCVAQTTFETGQVNSITQSRGINYAEMTSYPVKDEDGNVIECVVFIQDITDRILYHEEILGLYKEVAQIKDYLESLIDNSGDAIVTSDLNGIITSWNRAAEKLFDYSEAEATGKLLPFVPETNLNLEKQNIEEIKKDKIIKIAPSWKKKDETLISLSVSMSPIKDSTGNVIGISYIMRDIF